MATMSETYAGQNDVNSEQHERDVYLSTLFKNGSVYLSQMRAAKIERPGEEYERMPEALRIQLRREASDGNSILAANILNLAGEIVYVDGEVVAYEPAVFHPVSHRPIVLSEQPNLEKLLAEQNATLDDTPRERLLGKEYFHGHDRPAADES
jgi:hypothetical protein